MDKLINKFKSHIHFEEGMDDSNLSFYLESAKEYIKKATGGEKEYLILMVAGIMYDYRVSDWQLKEALDAITPFIIQEVYTDGTEELQEKDD